MIFYTKIKSLRNEENMTQEQLASKLNVSRNTVAKWENNLIFPKIESLIAISKLFEISLNDLILEPNYPDVLAINHNNEIIDFLVLAKKSTYAVE